MARKALLISLALCLALAAPALAQKKNAPKEPVPVGNQATVTNFGQRWSAMSDKERDYFIEGMVTAVRLVCTNTVMGGANPPKDMKEANKQFVECFGGLFPYKPRDIKEAMTSLYQDKANSVVPYDIMYGMALLKVKGDPYEDNLAKLRKDLTSRAK